MVKVKITIKFTLDVASKPMGFVEAAKLVPQAEYIAVEEVEQPSQIKQAVQDAKNQIFGSKK